jgi:hypothetical protein
MRRILMVLVFALCCQGFVLAADNVTVQDRMVAGTFKTMAKAYIATADLGQLKDKNIGRIESMREDWFTKQYAEVYAAIQDLPAQLKHKYRIRQNMTKREVIEVIRSLDKKEICQIIDQVPDGVISEQFNAQFNSNNGETKEGLMERVRMIWDKVVTAVNRPSKS